METTQGKTGQARSGPLGRAPGGALVTAVLLLGSAVSGTALAASSLNLDCAGKNHFMEHSAHADELSASELSVNVVDLTDTDSNVSLAEEGPDGSDESLAPLLYLAPRVASILEDVFDAEEDAVEAPTTLAPMAERSDEDAPVVTETEDTLEVQPALLRIHRQMYRTDI